MKNTITTTNENTNKITGGVQMKSLFTKHAEVAKVKEAAQSIGYDFGFNALGVLTLKKQEGIKYSIGEISNWVSKLILLLHDLDAAREAFTIHGFGRGYKATYVGLTSEDSSKIEEFKNEKTKAKVYYVSYDLDRKCIEEFNSSVWSDENVTKFLLDMIMVGRLYQEKTIDYAKKISKLEIQDSPMKKVKVLSLQSLSVSFLGGQVEIEVEEPKGKNIVIVNDSIHQTRMSFADDYKKYVEEIIMPEVNVAKLPEIMREELAMLKDSKELYPFVDMKTYYKDIVGGFFNTRVAAMENEEEEMISVAQDEFKEDKIRISNMLRMATAYMRPEQRGAYMKFISGRTKGNEEAENENKFYLSVCKEEFVQWLISMGLAEVPFAGYKLIANKGYEAGDFVHFENGMATKAILKNAFTGWAEIKEFEGTLYAAIELEDLIPTPAIDNRIIMKVKQSFVKEFGADAVIKAINTARDCEFVAEGNRYCLAIECEDGKTRDIPYDLNKWFFNILRGNKGSIVKASKNTIKTINGSEIDSVYINIDLNEIPVVAEIPEMVKNEDVVVIEESSEI